MHLHNFSARLNTVSIRFGQDDPDACERALNRVGIRVISQAFDEFDCEFFDASEAEGLTRSDVKRWIREANAYSPLGE